MKTIIILSGGMDSTTLLYEMLYMEEQVEAITIDYGQRHRKEIDCAKNLCDINKVPWDYIDLSSIGKFLVDNSQTDERVPVPHGRYDEESMRRTVVPNRNMMMLSVAGAIAIARKANSVAYGAHAGDHTIYPDCRQAFVEVMKKAFTVCDWSTISLYTPYLSMHKGEICLRGSRLDVPFQLTWTCYEGGDVPCEKCGACVERREAFDFANIPDPLLSKE